MNDAAGQSLDARDHDVPRVQVIVPAYNAQDFIAETLESVLAQSSRPDDVLVVDNASTDRTRAIVANFAGRGVRYVCNAVNVGALGNHNRALEMASGRYLKILSADDVLLPGVIAKQAEALDTHANVGVVTCNCLVTDSRLNVLGETRYLNGYRRGTDAVRQCALQVANLIGAPSNTLLRLQAISALRFDPTLKWLGDLDFFCRMLGRCDYLNIDEVGFLYRRHEGSDSSVSCSDPVRLHDERAFSRRHGGGRRAQLRIAYRIARERWRRLGAGMRAARS